MPGPSSRTDTSTRSGNASSSTQAGASGPTWRATLSRQAPTTAPARTTTAPGSSTGSAGAAKVTETGRSRPPSAWRRSASSSTRGAGERVLLADQRPQGALLLPGQPAELGAVAAELAAPPLHQGEHLEHAVVHGAGEPGPLGGRDLAAARLVALVLHQLQRLREEAHDQAADERAGRRCRSWPG